MPEAERLCCDVLEEEQVGCAESREMAKAGRL